MGWKWVGKVIEVCGGINWSLVFFEKRKRRQNLTPRKPWPMAYIFAVLARLEICFLVVHRLELVQRWRHATPVAHLSGVLRMRCRVVWWGARMLLQPTMMCAHINLHKTGMYMFITIIRIHFPPRPPPLPRPPSARPSTPTPPLPATTH